MHRINESGPGSGTGWNKPETIDLLMDTINQDDV